MRSSPELPHVLLARVLETTGPYTAGHVLSLALASTDVARVAVDGAIARSAEATLEAPLVPERVPVAVTFASGLFAVDEVLTLWFVDPRIVRIVRSDVPARVVPTAATENLDDRTVALKLADSTDGSPRLPLPAPPSIAASPAPRSTAAPLQQSAEMGGVRIRLHWTPERARRFVQVVDKLFTAERLGWYRHVFAMRLLVPDEVFTGNARADAEATTYLRDVRAAAVEALGRPLLAAFMPNFSVSSDWLDAIDTPSGAQAVASLRQIVSEHASCDAVLMSDALEEAWTIGSVTRLELADIPHGSVEALLPVLIPSLSPSPGLTERLSEYRRALIEIFAQTAGSAETVRLTRMSQPNHLLDDRLWQLVGVVSETFGGVAVA